MNHHPFDKNLFTAYFSLLSWSFFLFLMRNKCFTSPRIILLTHKIPRDWDRPAFIHPSHQHSSNLLPAFTPHP